MRNSRLRITKNRSFAIAQDDKRKFSLGSKHPQYVRPWEKAVQAERNRKAPDNISVGEDSN